MTEKYQLPLKLKYLVDEENKEIDLAVVKVKIGEYEKLEDDCFKNFPWTKDVTRGFFVRTNGAYGFTYGPGNVNIDIEEYGVEKDVIDMHETNHLPNERENRYRINKMIYGSGSRHEYM